MITVLGLDKNFEGFLFNFNFEDREFYIDGCPYFELDFNSFHKNNKNLKVIDMEYCDDACMIVLKYWSNTIKNHYVFMKFDNDQ